MNYYQELGLASSAASEEIREAYRNLVRLLHPDQQRDPALKKLAECQMRRANQIHEVLSDPERRRRYDSEIASENPERQISRPIKTPPPIPPSTAKTTPRRKWDTAAWLATALVGILGICWYVTRQPIYEAALPEVTGAKYLDWAAPKHFAGTWFYSQQNSIGNTSVYAPKYMEMVISEENGALHGRYRARYQAPGGSLSPDVAFMFEGRPQGNTARFPWSALGRTKGDVQLRLVSENALEIVWTATQMEKEMGLVSGTAVLVRQGER